LHPIVVINGIFCSKVPDGDAAGCISTWPGEEMRVIDSEGICGRHSWPLECMDRGGGGLVMLAASREEAHFQAMPDRFNRKWNGGGYKPGSDSLLVCREWRPFFYPRVDSSPTQSSVAPFRSEKADCRTALLASPGGRTLPRLTHRLTAHRHGSPRAPPCSWYGGGRPWPDGGRSSPSRRGCGSRCDC